MKTNVRWEGILAEPDEYFGFIYLITNTVSGKLYLGKKQYHSYKTKPPLKGKKRRRKATTESDWKTYTGSSTNLNADIEELGIDNFKFEIVAQCPTKAALTYCEVSLQHKMDVLLKLNKDGERAFYNGNIGAIRFIPPNDSSYKDGLNYLMKHTTMMEDPIHEQA